MSTTVKYLVFGPASTLKRLTPALVEELKPKYTYLAEKGDAFSVHVVVYEEYLKPINSSVSLTCVFEFTGKQTKIEITSTGGRRGFRGSSLDIEETIEKRVLDFILDFSKRYGLSVQEETDEPEDTEE